MKSRDPKLLPSIVDVVTAGAFAFAQAKFVEKGYDPNAVALLTSSSQALVVRMAEFFSEKSNDIAIYRQQRDADFFAEVDRQLAKLWVLVNRTAQKAINVHEAIALIEQYRDNAARSVLEERRKLLAAAAAATFRPDVDVEMKSRAERAIAALEPSDIEALRMLKHIIALEESGPEVRVMFDEYPLINRIALEQSGCVITHRELVPSETKTMWGAPPPSPQLRQLPDITPIGETVLTLVETYNRNESGQSEEAGGVDSRV